MWFRHFPPDLKARLSAIAAEQGTSFNTVAVSMLAKHFRVRYKPNPRRGPGTGPSTKVTLQMPLALRTKIGVQAKQRQYPGGAEAMAVDALRLLVETADVAA